MPIKRSGYYNDPAMAQAAENLSSLFAPPSGTDAAGWAQAGKTRQETEALAEYYRLAKDPNADLKAIEGAAIAANLYDPSNSFYAVDTADKTQRYGYDQSRASALDVANVGLTGTKYTADQNRASNVDTALLSPVGPNQTRFVPPDIATSRKLDATQTGPVVAGANEDITVPGTDVVIKGPRTPLNLDQAQAQAFQKLTPQEQQDVVQGKEELVQAVDPVTKQPVWMTRGQAVRLQAAPYKPPTMDEVNAAAVQTATKDNPQAQKLLVDHIMHSGETPVKVVQPGATQPTYKYPSTAVTDQTPAFVDQQNVTKVENGQAIMNDGTQVPVYQQPGESIWRNTQTKQPIDMTQVTAVTNLGTPQGGTADLLPAPVDANIKQQIVDIGATINTAQQLRDMIAKAPASQGMVGWLRGSFQDVAQIGGELGAYFGGPVKVMADKVTAELKANGATDDLLKNFDKNIPAIQMMSNLLAFQYAKTLTGERLSNETLKTARNALGLEGITSNQTDATARLQQAAEALSKQQQYLDGILKKGTAGALVTVTPPPPPAAIVAPGAETPPAAAAGGGGPKRRTFDANGNPVQ